MTEGTATASTDQPTTRPRKQEQEPASAEITELAPGILRLQLPIELPGLGHVNTYALEDGEGFALVDPGLPGEPNWQNLQDRLQRAGIPLARIHTVVVTHSHPDHFGASGLLAEQTGARLVTSTQFRIWWDDLQEASGEELDPADDAQVTLEQIRAMRNLDRKTPWGGQMENLPPERREEFERNFAESMKWFRIPRPTHRLDDNDCVTLAGREWFGLFTPGHTNDHLCLWDPEAGILLSGDHVLPTITPHISGMIEGDSLASYVENLDRVAELDGVQLVLPAHGHPFTDLAGRVAEVKEHHEARLDRVRQISAELGWATVEDVSHQLFAPRSWGSMADSETYAHLEHFRRRGEATARERTDGSGLLEFLVDG
jgi:glyoxylase-like metal-dependent hydrolase (beta-lactamase superfamily II)